MIVTLFSLVIILLSNPLTLNNTSKTEYYNPVVAITVNTPTNTPTVTATLTPTLTPTPLPILTFTPTPTLIPEIITSGSLEDLFTKSSAQYSVDKELLKKIANCESGFNPNAVNMDYAGIFQFSSSTWTSVRGRMGLNNDQGLRFNAEESINTAAFEISQRGTSAWSNCD